MYRFPATLTVVAALVGGCAHSAPIPRSLSETISSAAPALAADAPDNPDTLAYARRLVVDANSGLLRALVQRLAAQVRSREPVDSLVLVRVMELWSEYAGQPQSQPDSAAYFWASAAVRVKERELGPDHHELAHSLGILGGCAEAALDRDVMTVARERAVRILRGKQGRERAGLLVGLADLGRLAYVQNLPARAESLMREAVDEGKAAGLTEQPRYQSVLNNLAIVLFDRGAVGEALGIHAGLLELRLRQFGPVHRRVQLTRINLGNLLAARASYEEALEQARVALTLDSLLAGQGASRRAVILQNIASILTSLGDFAAGRRLLEEAIAARPAGTSSYLHILLADSFRKTGDRRRAHDYYEIGLRELRATGGLKIQQAAALFGLASLEVDERRPDSAIPLYQEALQLRLEGHGHSHAETAAALLALAGCQADHARLDLAAMHADSGSRVLGRALPAGHPDRAQALLIQARILELRGRMAEAVPLFESADTLIRDSFGPEHPRRATVLGEIARFAAALGDTARAVEAIAHAARIQRRTARLALTSLTENEAIVYSMAESRHLDVLLSYACERGSPTSDLTGRAFDETIRSRAMILDAMVARRRAGTADETAHSDRSRLDQARRRLARLWVAGLRDRSPETHRAFLDSAWGEVERAEKATAGQHLGALRHVIDPPGVSEVRTALPPGSVLVSYVRYQPAAGRRTPTRRSDPSGPGRGEPPGTVSGQSSARYLAFVQKAGEERTTMVSLSTAAAIDSAIERWRRVAETDPDETREAEARYRRVATALRRLVWDPIARHVTGATRLYVVPDGQLQLVDLSVLPTSAGRYLLESAPPIALLTAELDLLAASPAAPGGEFLALGEPEFDAAPSLAIHTAAPAAVRRGPDSCEEFARRKFEPLPASGLELRDVANMWRSEHSGRTAVLLRGREATESRLREAAPRASELHIATHGFFLSEHCGTDQGPVRGGSGDAVAHASTQTALLRAGLVLAGANRRLGAADAEDDGILTAEEIAGLDLRNTRSVVLSACEAGQGKALGGEGVFGLRRALCLAGARSMVMSLWRMEDSQARAWMNGFYAARWKDGRDVATATRAASLGLLDYRRHHGLPTHPYTWGGFIAVGD